jgi:hypothetical protein
MLKESRSVQLSECLVAKRSGRLCQQVFLTRECKPVRTGKGMRYLGPIWRRPAARNSVRNFSTANGFRPIGNQRCKSLSIREVGAARDSYLVAETRQGRERRSWMNDL